MSDTTTLTRPVRKSARERLAEFDAKGRDQRFAEYVAHFDIADAAQRGCLKTEAEAEVFGEGMRAASRGPGRPRKRG